MAFIDYIDGDILQSNAEALVNTVNCVGIMGRGIALQFKNAYPENFQEYKIACSTGQVMPGRMLIHETGLLGHPRYIINFPTKRHWKGKSRIEDIEIGLDALVRDIDRLNITSIAIPPLGSGLGGLPWQKVRTLIERKFSEVDDVRLYVYEPNELRVATRSPIVPKMTVSRAAMIKLIDRYQQGLMDPFVSLLEVQKLMYFMQVFGEPLRLRYEKGSYGPYSPTLSHVLNAVEGYYISGYGDGGDDPRKPLDLVPGAVIDADNFLATHEYSTNNLEKVSNLVRGFETSFGLELLATVHWIAATEGIDENDQLVEKIHNWNSRKKMFTSRQISFASQRLRVYGLI